MTQQEQLKKNLNRLDEMAQLPVSWSSYDEWAISPLLIKKCKEFLPKLPYQPYLSRTGRGSIHLEYKQPNGDLLEIEYRLDKITGSYSYGFETGIVESDKIFDMTNNSDEEIYRIVMKFCNYE